MATPTVIPKTGPLAHAAHKQHRQEMFYSRSLRVSLALALALASAALASAQRPVRDVVRDTTLANGLQVIVVKSHTVPFVTLEMAFKCGAFVQQVPEYAGLPHLIEHMLFRSDGGTFAQAANDIEASWNGVTGTESVRYFLTFPSKHLGKGMSILSKLVRDPDFSKSSLETERKVVQGELERRASEPDALLQTESDLQLWGVNGFNVKNPGGNLLALNEATPQRLKELYARFYVPNNAALVVAGDVSETEVFALASGTFKDWKRGDDPLASVKPSPIAPLAGIQRRVVSADVRDVTFLVRWHGPGVTADAASTWAADVFAGLVNQRISATQKRLVDSGVFDDVSLNYETLNRVGPIELWARTSPDRAEAAADALGDELTRFAAADYFSAEDLALAKTWNRVSSYYRLERSATAANIVADFWSTAGLGYFVDYADKLDAQTEADVKRFVAQYIAGKAMAVTVRVPRDEWGKIGVPLQRGVRAWSIP